jgi:hypothetical protein
VIARAFALRLLRLALSRRLLPRLVLIATAASAASAAAAPASSAFGGRQSAALSGIRICVAAHGRLLPPLGGRGRLTLGLDDFVVSAVVVALVVVRLVGGFDGRLDGLRHVLGRGDVAARELLGAGFLGKRLGLDVAGGDRGFLRRLRGLLVLRGLRRGRVLRLGRRILLFYFVHLYS